MVRNILLTIEYDGTGFHGWQRQPEVRTVQGVLEEALSRVCATPITIDGVSRTDAGVHALGQRATFSGDFGIPADRIPIAVNGLLSGTDREGDLRIIESRQVPSGFHARFDARGKKYRYMIRNEESMAVFLRNYRYQVPETLDLDLMRTAASYIVGEHDFACFQAAGGTPRETTVRTVTSLDIFQAGEAGSRDISIEIAGDGFLYNMVRIITGTLVEVGRGKITPEQMINILDSHDRGQAGHTAPPQGLYLVEVYY
ncbi:tRNA pseudouridine(38-40) synthase TruA [Aminicella lysinilytica]|uniref:tRNA pseudouridine(38-40) synthase TruA n=1 Tax=Aminicella lysinilytica TaxID=433323 RepID=UPI0026ED2A6B|nr:tRNA pseudouridine(38-40) synthase TruA [Aminicella lysinilytica]